MPGTYAASSQKNVSYYQVHNDAREQATKGKEDVVADEPTIVAILDLLILVLLNFVRTNLDTLVIHVLWGMNSAMFVNVRNPASRCPKSC